MTAAAGKALPLHFVLGLKDQATAGIRSFGNNLKRTYEQIGGSVAKQRLKDASGHLRAAGDHARGFAQRLSIVAAAAGGAYYAVRRFASEGDRIAKSAARLGLGVEELQEWEFASGQAGVSQEKFNQSLAVFSRNLGSARLGTGALYSTLQRSDPGMLSQLLSASDTSSALETYLRMIARLRNASDRSLAAQAAFGDAGAPMVNLAMAGQQEIDRLRARARELGLISAEAAKAAEVNSDSWDETVRAARGAWYALASQLLPALTDAQNGWTKRIVENRQAIADWAAEFAKTLPERLERMESIISRLADALAGLLAVVNRIDKAVGIENLLLLWVGAKAGSAVVSTGKAAGSVLSAGKAALGGLGVAGTGVLGASLAAIAGVAGYSIYTQRKEMEAGTFVPASGTTILDKLLGAPGQMNRRANALPSPADMARGGPLPQMEPIRLDLTVHGLPEGMRFEASSRGMLIPVRRGRNAPGVGSGGDE